MNKNPGKSRLWVDGDAFRAPAGTPLPTTDLFTATSFVDWDAYGAIKAGFQVATAQESSNLSVWGDGAYRKKKQDPITTATLRPVEDTKASILTFLQGGSIAETSTGSGVWEWIAGDDEEFALLLIARDPGHGSKAYYAPRVTLDKVPDEVLNDDDLNGYDLAVTFLSPTAGGLPIRRFTDSNPLAATP